MKQPSSVLFIVTLISVIPAYYLNRYLQKIIQPRQSFARLMVYLLSGLALVFIYTFLIVKVILWLFPPSLK